MSRLLVRAGVAVSLSAAAGAAASVFAAESDAALEDPIPIVIISATPLPGAQIARDQVPAPVQVATAEDIERTHAIDLTAFMNRTLGSVYINDIQNNPLQPDINYRGFTASPLLGTPQGVSVYLDGVRLNQPFGDVVSWDLIPRQAIATMALMPGSNPLFGLNTLGGALALRTKDGRSHPGISAELNYGSNSRRQASVEVGGRSDHGFFWYGTANKLQDDGWRAASPTDATQGFVKLGWRDSATELALVGSVADTDLNGNGLQDLQLLQRDYDSVYTKPDNTQNRSYLLNLVATHKVNDAVTLSGNAYYRNLKTGTYNGDINDDALGEALYQPSAPERAALAAAGYTGFPASGETQENTPFPSWRCIANILTNEAPNEKCNALINQSRTRQHDSGVSVQATYASLFGSRANQFTAGGTIVESAARFVQSARFGYLTPDRGVASVDGEGAFSDGTQDSEDAFDARVNLSGDTQTRSLFFMDTLQVSPIVQLTFSGRFDRTSVENRDGITPAGEPGSLDGDHHFNRFNPAVGVTVSPTSRFSAYLGYNEGSRAPSAIELGCADPDNPCRLPNAMAGDPPLDQVVTRTFETGVRGVVTGLLAWNAGLFRSENSDDIMFVADDQAGFGYFRNFGKTRRQGAELGLTAHAGGFDVGANYTFLDATYRSAEEVNGEGNSSNEDGPGLEGNIAVEPGDRIPLVPRHLFKAFASWQILPQLSANIDFITVAGTYARGNENNQHEPDGEFYLGPGRTGGYSVVNFGAEYRWLSTLTVFAQVNNLLDREYFTAAQLGPTGFNAAGDFVSRPFAEPVVDGERPLLGTTYFAPGAPRAYWLGVRYSIGKDGG